ncbi:TetR/AcrR family transcriptional regulator [Paenibacillus rhizovicinus]|uniref:TetR/AcrR family transcriptional regulator n=1 Tax=Paenibacillus rhizovicinus TaxID=2704463 RepID=A0A6C0NTL3_9BACL|nr:TetR/AcrR family transcriptional regulator [Paenibacillus rhizovicinus]QHW29505.1 TetR/AcrR family transcriptional regulator [Paenibacillus rhizovicinus]
MNIKEHIMKTALNLFSKNGYNATSMQEIAEQCGIAKGSIYKFFLSKEDLFIGIFDMCYQELFEQAERFVADQGRSPREHFIQLVEFQIQYFIKNEFIMMDFTHRELPIQRSDKFEEVRNRNRIKKMNWHKELIVAAYGTEIEPYVWDLIVIFRGFLTQYLYYIIYENRPLSINKVSLFIVERLSAIVQDLLHDRPDPLLDKSILRTSDDLSLTADNHAKSIRESLNAIARAINDLKTSDTVRHELNDTLKLLTDEIWLKEPREFLIHALMGHLARNNEIQGYLKQLEFILIQTAADHA